jgi:hypothetical protein
MAVEIAVVTKLTTENSTIMTARQTDTVTSARKVGLASKALKLSAVTGLSLAARTVRASSRSATVFSSHPALPAARARHMLSRVPASTSIPLSAA